MRVTPLIKLIVTAYLSPQLHGTGSYDLFYVWTGVGVEKVADILTQLRPNVHIDSALDIIEKDFTELDGLGPMGTALFIARVPDDDIQADVVGQARALLRSAGRL